MRVAIFKRPPRAQFLTKSKNFCAHQIENYLEIILGFEILKKVIPSLSYGRSKFGPKSGENCYVFTPSVTFSGFHCFHFHCVLFLVISFQTPPPAQRASIATQCCSPAGPPSLRDGFLRGGLKGNDPKKYTLEVKTVKAIKSDGLV